MAVMLLDNCLVTSTDIRHTAVFKSYSHIRMLKAIIARSPWRNIPNESIKAPFSQPRLSVPGVGMEDTDVLVKDTAGSPAPPGPANATSPGWDSMWTPLPVMDKKSWKRLSRRAKDSCFSNTGGGLPSPLQQMLVS